MKLEPKILEKILVLIESASSEGVSFDDTVDQADNMFGDGLNPNSTMARIGISRSERDEYLDHMLKKEFVRGTKYKNGWAALKLSPSGHEYLAEIRANTFIRRVFAFSMRWSGKVVSSVVLPIVAAVATVLVMNYFGIDGASKKSP